MKKYIVLFAFLLVNFTLMGQVVEWSKKYEGEYLRDLEKTNDGGFLLGGDKNERYWVVKIDSLGQVEWEDTYGTTYPWLQLLYDLEKTSDGFILGGVSNGEGGDVSENNGELDYWVVKINLSGNIMWEKSYGGGGNQRLRALKETDDGGFILGGGGTFDNALYGIEDFWVIKTDIDGNLEWEKNYGGSQYERIYSLETTNDGGFLLGGHTNSSDGLVGGGVSAGAWVIKTDMYGNIEWKKKYGGGIFGKVVSLQEIDNDGFLVGTEGFWIYKVDSVGNTEWGKNYGDSQFHELADITKTSDGGFLLGGSNQSNSINGESNYGEKDFFIVKIDGFGNLEWKENYGSAKEDILYAVEEVGEGEFLLEGNTEILLENDFYIKRGWLLKIREINKKITAKPFYDQNENGILDEEEQPLYNLPFTINPTAIGNVYNVDGGTTFYVEPNNYSVQYDNTSNGLWQVENAPESYTIEIEDEPIDTTFYFPMQPVTDFYIQWVDLSAGITRCNQNTNVWLTYTNNSSESTSGYVNLVADDFVNFASAVPPVDSIAGDTLFWFYENLYPTHSEQIKIVYEMPSVDFLGANINFDAQIETWEGYGNDKDLYNSELICAYDPNDKQVEPSGYGTQNYTLFDDTLDYLIRFQNTGNDTAFNIIIRDTISDYLDLSSFRFIASSHEANVQINENTRIIEFQFDDIYLPDSNVNEIASHGFVKFEIEAIEGLAQNTVIENTAGIYFDFNPAIVTNTTHNTMVDPLPLLESAVALKVYLEGAFNPLTGAMKTDLQNLSILPTNQPFNIAPYNYNGTEAINIPMSFPENTVDWVLVEARTGTPNISTAQTTLIESAAGFLLADGTIVGVDGTTLIFTELEFSEGYHFVIRHRNHLDIISTIDVKADAQMSIDFTASVQQAFGTNQQKILPNGKPAMYAGDYNQDGVIQTTDYDLWKANPAQNSVYENPDGTLDGIIQTTDFDVWRPNKAKLGNVEIQF